MRGELFQPTVEGEARVLLLIDAFSKGNSTLEGRTKLAKLDFFLRYPLYLNRALTIRNGNEMVPPGAFISQEDIETKMVRYRYGPWDPAYYAILGRLIGKGLVESIFIEKGVGYRSTEKGRKIARDLSSEEVWQDTAIKIALIKKHLNLSGSSLKKFIYEQFPEITRASWGQSL